MEDLGNKNVKKLSYCLVASNPALRSNHLLLSQFSFNFKQNKDVSL